MFTLRINVGPLHYTDTYTSQYSHVSSFEPFHRKTAWVKSLFYRYFKICSSKALFNNQIETIKSFMSWNGYPNGVRNFLIKKLKTKYIDSSTSDAVNHDTDDDTVYCLKFGFVFLISETVAIFF